MELNHIRNGTDKKDKIIIEKLYESINKLFPFKGYMDTCSQFGKIIAGLLGDYLATGSRILDFGSGPCDKTALYKRLGYECYACDDLNDDWHNEGDNKDIIKEFARREGIHFSKMAGGEIPYEEEFFDGILIIDVIEHLHDSPRELLNNLVGKLKTNGYIFVGMPNSVNIRKRLSVLFGKTNYPPLKNFYFSKETWRGHVREYTLEETKQLIKNQNLEVVYASGVNAFASRKISNKYIRGLYVGLTKLFPSLSETILVIGKKPEDWHPVSYSSEKDPQYKKSPWFATKG